MIVLKWHLRFTLVKFASCLSFLLTRAHPFWLFSHFLNLIVSMIVMLRITWLKDVAMERAEHVASTP